MAEVPIHVEPRYRHKSQAADRLERGDLLNEAIAGITCAEDAVHRLTLLNLLSLGTKV
jgi:hypothetical protein